MMIENLIQEIKKNGGSTTPEKLAYAFGILKEDAEQILKYGEMVGIFINSFQDKFEPLEVQKRESLIEFQTFLDRFWKDMKRTGFMQIFSIEIQTKKFGELQPFFYDKMGCFWLWNHESFCWQMVDDVDMLNMIKGGCEIQETADSKIITPVRVQVSNQKLKAEILNEMKQQGRLNIPIEVEPSWIQFRDKIIDIETDAEFKAEPKYFVTNPILWKIGETEETPTINKLFKEWVGEEHIQELYEIIAFCFVPKYFIHRIFWLIGSGSNGKSTYLNLLRKFIGGDNITSVSLDALMTSRFAGAKLFKKLVCLMGETNFNTLSKTDFLKKLSGEDFVPGEIKNKNPFDFVNYAKLIMASNSMPMTADKTDGFYRRQKIVDFPNKFDEEKEVLSSIPQKEFENLARKCLTIVKKLWNKRIFSDDGNFEDRRRKYEERSNPVMLYIQENFEKEINSQVLFSEFSDGLRDFLSENGFRELTKPVIAKQLKIEGFDVKNTTINNVKGSFILGIKKKGEKNEL